MTDCEKYQELISAMLDGELTDAERAEVEAHVRDCDECRAMYEAFSAVSGAMDAVDVPDTLHSGIMDKVNAAAKAKKTHGTIVRLRPVLATAACLAVIVGTVFALKGNLGGMKNADTAAPAAAEAPMMMMTNTATAAGADAQKLKGTADGAEVYFTEAAECASPEAPAPEASCDACAAEESEAKPLPSLCLRIETIYDSGAFTATVTKSGDSPFAEGEVLLVEMDETTEPIAFNLVEGGEYRVFYTEILESETVRIHAERFEWP